MFELCPFKGNREKLRVLRVIRSFLGLIFFFFPLDTLTIYKFFINLFHHIYVCNYDKNKSSYFLLYPVIDHWILYLYRHSRSKVSSFSRSLRLLQERREKSLRSRSVRDGESYTSLIKEVKEVFVNVHNRNRIRIRYVRTPLVWGRSWESSNVSSVSWSVRLSTLSILPVLVYWQIPRPDLLDLSNLWFKVESMNDRGTDHRIEETQKKKVNFLTLLLLLKKWNNVSTSLYYEQLRFVSGP